MLLALAAAMSDIVFVSVVLMSRFGKRRDFAGCVSGSFVTPLPFACVVDRVLLPALSAVCESEAANKTVIATTRTRDIRFLVKGEERKDIKNSLV
jgi:hypothetical protein